MNRLSFAAALIGATLGFTCAVNFPEDAKFACASNVDCAGDGFVCAAGVCCKPADEVCDGRDNDCNGKVDDTAPTECYSGPEGTAGVASCKKGSQACVAGELGACTGEVLPGTETCNGADEDCDGTADDGFDLQTDPMNCGMCGRVCLGTEVCAAGACSATAEGKCADGLDDEGDGKTDCLDEDCEGKSCGAGCICRTLAKHETGCGGGLDEDGDMLADCLDADCAMQECDAGCACRTDGGRQETDCLDVKDNDGDGQFDCVDTADCVMKLCRPAPQTYTCTAAQTCACNGSLTPPAERRQNNNCNDDIDNECDGRKDCVDVDCNMAACNPRDGGPTGTCRTDFTCR